MVLPDLGAGAGVEGVDRVVAADGVYDGGRRAADALSGHGDGAEDAVGSAAACRRCRRLAEVRRPGQRAVGRPGGTQDSVPRPQVHQPIGRDRLAGDHRTAGVRGPPRCQAAGAAGRDRGFARIEAGARSAEEICRPVISGGGVGAWGAEQEWWQRGDDQPDQETGEPAPVWVLRCDRRQSPLHGSRSLSFRPLEILAIGLPASGLGPGARERSVRRRGDMAGTAGPRCGRRSTASGRWPAAR